MLKKMGISLKRYLQKNSKKKICNISFVIGAIIGSVSFAILICILNKTLNVDPGILLVFKILSCILSAAIGYTSKEKSGWIIRSMLYKSDFTNTIINK